MKRKSRFSSSLTISYTVIVLAFLAIASIGFLMFGAGLEKEITINIRNEPFYNEILSQFLIWLIVINPISKYALMLFPVSSYLESMGPGPMKLCYKLLIRSVVCLLTLVISILFPDFEKLLAVVGSMCSITVCVLFPCACYIKIFSRNSYSSISATSENDDNDEEMNMFLPIQRSRKQPAFPLPVAWTILISSSIVAIAGTIWPFVYEI
jgi:hypothetical protein